jgi:putative aldouronate transport system permease protein
MVLWYGIGIWNSWFWASVILRRRELYPLQVILREILLQSSALEMIDSGDQEAISETIKYATIIVATVPVLCIYPFLQKHFARGVLLGGVKG